MTEPTPSRRIARECIAVRLRLLGRAVNALYDDALRPLGLRIGQLNLLVTIAESSPARPADICRQLAMDKSTLSRDLDRIKANGWVESLAGDDGRSSLLQLTAEGKDLLARSVSAWEGAQEKAAALLGAEGVSAVSRAARAAWKGGPAGG